MKKTLILSIFIILLSSTSFASCREFSYAEEVKVVSGFYKGLVGNVYKKVDDCTYTVEFVVKADNIPFQKLIDLSANDLEKTK